MLSPKERSIVRLMMCGLPNKEIAFHVGLTYQSLKMYLHLLYCKLAVDSERRMMLWAFAHPEEWENAKIPDGTDSSLVSDRIALRDVGSGI